MGRVDRAVGAVLADRVWRTSEGGDFEAWFEDLAGYVGAAVSSALVQMGPGPTPPLEDVFQLVAYRLWSVRPALMGHERGMSARLAGWHARRAVSAAVGEWRGRYRPELGKRSPGRCGALLFCDLSSEDWRVVDWARDRRAVDPALLAELKEWVGLHPEEFACVGLERGCHCRSCSHRYRADLVRSGLSVEELRRRMRVWRLEGRRVYDRSWRAGSLRGGLTRTTRPGQRGRRSLEVTVGAV